VALLGSRCRRLVTAAFRILLGMLRKDLPEKHDKSYDSPVLEALNKGGHLYISPPFLSWAKLLMTRVRASTTVGVIRSFGSDAQKKGYNHLLRNDDLKNGFKRATNKSEIDEDSMEWVFKRVVEYAFHARSAIEWRKYKAEKTDRTAGKEKKMSRRDALKGGGSTKKEEEHRTQESQTPGDPSR